MGREIPLRECSSFLRQRIVLMCHKAGAAAPESTAYHRQSFAASRSQDAGGHSPHDCGARPMARKTKIQRQADSLRSEEGRPEAGIYPKTSASTPNTKNKSHRRAREAVRLIRAARKARRVGEREESLARQEHCRRPKSPGRLAHAKRHLQRRETRRTTFPSTPLSISTRPIKPQDLIEETPCACANG
jgi:hypothetical protein